MNEIPHPSSVLQPEWTNIIRNEADSAEKKGSLTKAQLELIYQQEWFKLFFPVQNSTTPVSLPEALLLEEALSWADGSLGWTVTLCSGAGWFSGFFEDRLTKELLNDPTLCLGGSGAPSGTATRTEGGYRLTGRWKYATGAAHLTHFTANCIIKENGETVQDENGDPLILPFVFGKEGVIVINDWKTIGLVATSSQSFEATNLFVPSLNCFRIAPESLKVSQPVYQYPFLQFAEVTLAANISGMAIHFIDCCKDIFKKRLEGKKLKNTAEKHLSESLIDAENNLSKARSHFYNVVESSWQKVIEGSGVSDELLQDISFSSRELASTAQGIVNDLYPLCGLLAANPASEINRVWRDLHTASQHSLLTLP